VPERIAKSGVSLRQGAGPVVLARIAAVGIELEMAYGIAAESPPDSVGERAAWARAERATLEAGGLVEQWEEARPLVLAAAARVRRRRV
jgi:hypothetical protein